ncbi:MAG: hypothetical protein K2X74_20380 [Acetobacteraceae bacterium]|nr:hypothetical protein [Acetobacteraceae bacterium]
MFSLAHVLLPFSDTPPADAIRDSLARFRRGLRGEVPDDWLEFDDATDDIRRAHQAELSFAEQPGGGLRVSGDIDLWTLDTAHIRGEMRRLGLREWRVRFADHMALDAFFDRYIRGMERHGRSAAFGRWRNGLGRWDWWDLGGRFDGAIVGDTERLEGRGVARISSGPARGRTVLARVEDQFAAALGQDPPPPVEVHADRNIELVATLLEAARAGRGHAFPGAIVLPPGAVADPQRWMGTWPRPGPVETFAWLGLPADAHWGAVVTAAYARFESCWAAGIAYHH